MLKRILGDLTGPLTLLFLLMLVGIIVLWLGKKRAAGKFLVTVSAALLLVVSYGWVSDGMLRALERRYPPLLDAAPHRGVKWVAVLGGGLVSDPRLPLTGQLTEGSQLRVIEGIRLYRQIKGARLLMSGGAVFNTVPEGRAMAGLAMALGVPAKDIAQDTLSPDTGAQARCIRDIVRGDSLILVTSAYHLPRSMALFARQGMACVAAPAQYLTKDPQRFNPDRLFPTSGGIQHVETLAHEYLGMAWSRLRGEI